MQGIEGVQVGHVEHSRFTPRRLVDAAHEFEAQMMKELLRPLISEVRQNDDRDPDMGSGSVLTDFASEALGRSLSRQGGLGIAREILRSLSPKGSGLETGEMPEKLQQNVLMNSPE